MNLKRLNPWGIWDLGLAYWFLNICDEIAFTCFLFALSFSISLPFLFLLSVFWFSCLGFFPVEITEFATRILFNQMYKEINIRTNARKSTLLSKVLIIKNKRNPSETNPRKKITFRQKFKILNIRNSFQKT